MANNPRLLSIRKGILEAKAKKETKKIEQGVAEVEHGKGSKAKPGISAIAKTLVSNREKKREAKHGANRRRSGLW